MLGGGDLDHDGGPFVSPTYEPGAGEPGGYGSKGVGRSSSSLNFLNFLSDVSTDTEL